MSTVMRFTTRFIDREGSIVRTMLRGQFFYDRARHLKWIILCVDSLMNDHEPDLEHDDMVSVDDIEIILRSRGKKEISAHYSAAPTTTAPHDHINQDLGTGTLCTLSTSGVLPSHPAVDSFAWDRDVWDGCGAHFLTPDQGNATTTTTTSADMPWLIKEFDYTRTWDHS